MNSKEIRLINLKALIQKAGTAAEFSKQTDTATSLLSQILSPNPTRNMGDRLARKIEEKLSLPHGWMDVLHQEHSIRKNSHTQQGLALNPARTVDQMKDSAVKLRKNENLHALLEIGALIEDFTPSELAELQAQVELIRRRKDGGF